jgi:hypothetical protein
MRPARRLAVGLVLASLLQIGPPGSPIDPSPTAAATARIGSFGTATIDGVETAGEWAAADVMNLFVPRSPFTRSGVDPKPATLAVMNDGKHLYAAVRVPGAHERTDVELQFDEDHDRRLERNDDVLAVSVLPTDTAPRALPLLDRFLHCVTVSSPGCRTDDTTSAAGDPPVGTNDGSAAGGVDGMGDFIEIVHPLASRDPLHDIQTAPGRILGLRVVVKFATGVAQGCPEPTCRWEGGFDTGDLVLATAPATFTGPAAMADALRIEGATVTPTTALPGTIRQVTYRVVNRSGRALVVPSYGRSGRHLAARIVETVENIDDPGPIGARAHSVETLGSENTVRVRGVDVVAALGGSVWPPDVAITMTTSLPTSNFPPGHYRYDLAIVTTLDSTVVRSASRGFELASVDAEWQASVGTAGRNGRGTVRTLSSGDGTVGLSLRELAARQTYAVSIVRGRCSDPLTVARAGSVTTNGQGRVVRTIALSRSATPAIRSAVASGSIFLRLVSGASIRCSRLAPVSLYTARLGWDVAPLAPARDADGTPVPTSASSVTVLGSRVIIGGTRWDAPNTTVDNVAWSSTDGSTWTMTRLGPSRSRLALATDGERAVAVGMGAAWHSTDGVTWTAAAMPPGPLAQSLLPEVTPLPGGGFLAAMWPQEHVRGCVLWQTTDGDRWERLTTTGLPDEDCTSLVAAPSEIIATGYQWIARSVDGGVTWSTRLRVSGSTSFRDTVVSAGGFFALGSGALYRSSDGQTWRQVGSIPTRTGYDGTVMNAAVPYGPGLVGVGISFIPADLEDAEVQTSGNGTAWRLSPLVQGWPGSAMYDAMVWGDRLVVAGDKNAFYWGEESQAAVWIARLLPPG